MSEATTLTATAAGRYANALFELAREDATLEAVDADLDALAAALEDSEDLRTLIDSPLYSRDAQGQAMARVAEAMGLGTMTRNVLGLMAQNRRLFALPAMIRDFRAMLAQHRGEVTADVTAARPLSEAQRSALAETVERAVGRTVKLNVAVDESLIGGLIVRVGSKMIDTSIRSRLMGLQNAMKEVG